MRKLIRLYHNWRYRRLYLKLLWHFLKNGMSGHDAYMNACLVFEYITCQERGDFLLHDYLGVPRNFSSRQDSSPSSCER